MRRISLLLFWIVIAEGQLNYNGNPLTENTEYTAEESQNYERNDGGRGLNLNELNKKSSDSLAAASSSLLDNKSKGKSLKTSIDAVPINIQLKDVSSNNNNAKFMPSATMRHASPANPSIKVLDSTSHMQMQSRGEYSTNQRDSTEKIRIIPRQIASSVSSEALNSFLNSRTPEESQYALEKYLQAQERVNQSPVQFNPSLNVENYNTPPAAAVPVNTKTLQFLPNPRVDVNQATADQIDDIANLQSIPKLPSAQKMYETQPLRPAQSSWYQGAKNKAYYRPGMRSPYLHHQGRFPSKKYLQSRLASDYGMQGLPMNVPVGYNPYNKRTNRRYGPYAANSPAVYAAYPPPAVTNPPVDGNALYSQLYAQSYDPHYYDYIGKTGKIKPWLYGKLGSNYRKEPSMWNELYHSFKKHGMKNIMNPMFLLGLSIPALTLMLSAIITKRSFGRSADGGGGYISEDILNELEEKVRSAIEYYENNVNGDKKNLW